MVTWQFWTLFGLLFLGIGRVYATLEKLLEATYHTNKILYELTDQVKLVQGNAFQIERHTESLERHSFEERTRHLD